MHKIFKNIYYNNDFNFIEQTEEGTYIFYPEQNSQGYEVASLKDLKPILIYWRLSTVFNIFFIMTLFVILIFFTHQIINISCLFSITILTLCTTSCLVSGTFMWYLKRFKKVPPKIKINPKFKTVIISFAFVVVIACVTVLYMCPCLFYGHNLENQEWTKALNTINFCIQLHPKNDNLYENRAIAKYNLNDINGAIADCNKALELNPKNAWSLSGKAYFLFIEKRKITPEIKSLLEKSIELSNEYPIGYSDRAKIYFLLGESNKAIKDFKQAYIKSGNEYFNYFAAITYEQKGDYCKAFAYYNTVPQNKHFQISELPMKKEYAKFMCKE